ncbi:unnamed protein product [Phytophthora fragariaefolia]|uniref:Unnamed protein product n=1 Tax=Phytophthora fragariaefolia TaxID=1490495 RepID=A0A9W6Y3Z2_9STRA|nr:unnamed protein product [Phytophthora fragariaefolia]
MDAQANQLSQAKMKPPNPPKKRKTQERFDGCNDEALLQEILAVNPFQADNGTKTAAWAKVAATLELNVDARQNCRECCILLPSATKPKWPRAPPPVQTRKTKEQDAERADAMRNEVMKGMSKRKSKHDSFKELIEHAKERDNVTRSVELRKVSNREKGLALDPERLAL